MYIIAESRPLLTFPVSSIKEFDYNNMPRVLRSPSDLPLYSSEFQTYRWNDVFVAEWSAGLSDLRWLLLNASTASCSGRHC